jgi:sulfite reductase (NADPH) flavoprotein alpha-component
MRDLTGLRKLKPQVVYFLNCNQNNNMNAVLAYGTETGNSKRLATHLVSVAKKQGLHMKLVDLSQYRLSDLQREEYFFVVISTQGEGEPPLAAKHFYDHVQEQPLALPGCRFSVLALGDTAYPMFCKTGEDIDHSLARAGATRVVPLKKCDIDFDDDAEEWFSQVLLLLKGMPVSTPVHVSETVNKKPSGKKYYDGRIIANINLNDRGSNKQTNHIEIQTNEPIDYLPGDTIGILPKNRDEVVKRILTLVNITGDTIIDTGKFHAPVSQLLSEHLNICFLLTSTIKKYAGITGHEIPETRMDLIDLLSKFPVTGSGQFIEVVKVLMPIAPRLYSISSAPSAHGNKEVHITVAKDLFLAQEERRYGLCSEFLGDQPANTPISFYVHRDKYFKLPAPEKDLIMIGPGTGVAPFRSFLFERDANGANGRNWFFFGDQHFTRDFLYQSEIQQFLATGVLTKIDLAFSRDQSQKVYVQHRMREKGREIFQWIEQGAYVFISGTKDPMSRDVEHTLVDIIAEQGGRSIDDAKQYLELLKKERRFEKDVY